MKRRESRIVTVLSGLLMFVGLRSSVAQAQTLTSDSAAAVRAWNEAFRREADSVLWKPLYYSVDPQSLTWLQQVAPASDGPDLLVWTRTKWIEADTTKWPEALTKARVQVEERRYRVRCGTQRIAQLTVLSYTQTGQGVPTIYDTHRELLGDWIDVAPAGGGRMLLNAVCSNPMRPSP